MIKVGDKVTFDHLKDIKIRGSSWGSAIVKGTVIEIHEDRHWFAVEYKPGDSGAVLRTSFHFADIGETVFPCK